MQLRYVFYVPLEYVIFLNAVFLCLYTGSYYTSNQIDTAIFDLSQFVSHISISLQTFEALISDFISLIFVIAWALYLTALMREESRT